MHSDDLELNVLDKQPLWERILFHEKCPLAAGGLRDTLVTRIKESRAKKLA